MAVTQLFLCADAIPHYLPAHVGFGLDRSELHVPLQANLMMPAPSPPSRHAHAVMQGEAVKRAETMHVSGGAGPGYWTNGGRHITLKCMA